MTGQAPGKLWMYFLEAILVTIPASLVLLAGYRRAVNRSMRQLGDATTVPIPGTKAEPLDGAQAFVQSPLPAYDEPVKATRRRLALVYGMGGLVAAGMMAFLFALSMQFDLSPLGAFVSWYVYAWPIVPITVILLALPQNRNLVLLLLYVLIGGVVVNGWSWFSFYILGRVEASPVNNTRFYLEFLVRQSWLPYLIILVTGNRRLRPVSSLALAGLLVFSFGSLFARDLYIAAVQANPKASWLLFIGSNTYALWYFIAAVPIGYVCWLGIQRLASWYERKRFSDVQLLADSWWLIVAFQFSSEVASDFGWGGLAGLLAFVGYRGTVELGLRASRLPSDRRGPTLLLLRVFGFQRRTEALFDIVAERWRFRGPVLMIAGADLAMRTLNPGDVISFMSGRLKQRFIAGEEQVQHATGAIDMKPDPDGRFRTTKFFCHANTWRPTLTAILDRSDVVLMDLRGFSESNRGCVFELDQLIAHGLIPRTLFIADQVTNVALLGETVGRQAQAYGKAGTPPLQVTHLTKQAAAELTGIYEALRRIVGMGPSDST